MYFEINEQVFEKFPELQGERIKLREFSESDAEKLYHIRSKPEVMKYMDSHPEPNPTSVKHRIQEMRLAFSLKLGINWAIEEIRSREMIGYFGIWKIDKDNCRGEIGYALNPVFWQKGYMSETFRLAINFGFDKLHLHSFEANVNPKNENSIKLLIRQGFQKEAYFHENFLFDGKFLDSVVFSLLEKNREF